MATYELDPDGKKISQFEEWYPGLEVDNEYEKRGWM